MTTQNQLTMYAFLMNTAYNVWVDESSDPFVKKLSRAALNSIPMTLALDTKEIVGCVAKKMGINDIKQPETTFNSMATVLTNSTKTLEEYAQKRNMPAYYSKPEDFYKNFE